MNDKLNRYTAFGHRHGYPWGVTVVVEAASLEEAHEEAENHMDEVKSVSGMLPKTLEDIAE